MHKDELWQVYAANGEPIAGEGWDSALGNPEKTGSTAIVGVAIVFLYRFNKAGELEFLWQKRSDEIDRHPGDYDLSAGGHINLGESVTAAAVRECREEIGAEILESELRFVSVEQFNRNRFAWLFVVDYTGREDDFSFDDGEVSEVKWVPYAKMDDFRAKYAKKPLREDNDAFVVLDKWLRVQGVVKSEEKVDLPNYAFIDGQNLIYNTARKVDGSWRIDLERFRIYLRDKYKVSRAYYFIGAYDNRYRKMYDALGKYGYEVVFREHFKKLKSGKKGNVDTDIVFSAMKKLVEREEFGKILLVSDDGDYFKMVDYFIKKKKFGKLLAPSRKNLSLLYRKKIADKYIDYLDKREIKNKIELKLDIKNAGSP